MQYLLVISFFAALLSFGRDGAMAKEWSTPEALKAFGSPGDTVKEPPIADINKSSPSKTKKRKKETSAEISKEDNQSVQSGSAVVKKPDAGLENFKSEVVGAYIRPDLERIRTLMYPESLACLHAEPKYEQYLLRAETMEAIPSDAKISVETVSANATLPYRGFRFPLRPSHIVRMEFGKKALPDGSRISQIADKYIARVNSRWYLITPCPTPEGMARLREMGLLD